MLFSVILTPIYIPTKNAQEFPYFHILANKLLLSFYIYIYIYVYIYLFIFGCAVSSLLSAGFLLWCAGATPPCHALASIVGARGLRSCDVGTPWASVVVAHRFISSSSWALECSVAVAQGFSCSGACGIFPDAGLNL